MLGLLDPQDIACILYQSMLKPASGSHKRLASFACIPDGLNCTFHAPVWAPRGAPQCVKVSKDALPPVILQFRRWQPDYVHGHGQGAGGMLQGRNRRSMKARSRVVVANNSHSE
jgi:hypothetical protein